MFEKVIQMFEHVILGFGVLIGELEHHGPDEDLAAGFSFTFTDGGEDAGDWWNGGGLLSMVLTLATILAIMWSLP